VVIVPVVPGSAVSVTFALQVNVFDSFKYLNVIFPLNWRVACSIPTRYAPLSFHLSGFADAKLGTANATAASASAAIVNIFRMAIFDAFLLEASTRSCLAFKLVKKIHLN